MRGIKIGGGSAIISGGDATASDILLPKSAFVDGIEIFGSIVTAAGKTITPSTSAQTESSSGKYYSGDILVGAIPNQQNGGTWTPSTSAQTMVAANKYLKTAVSVNAIPNQQNGGSWTPSTSAQTMVAANKYLKTAATVAAIPSQTTGGAKYATTSAQTAVAASKYVTSAVTLGALSQSNLAAANIVNGITITIKNGSANVWSVAGNSNLYRLVSGTATGSTYPTCKGFYLTTDKYYGDCRYATINPGITPVQCLSFAWKNGYWCCAWRSAANTWNIRSSIGDHGGEFDGYINSNINSSYRFTSSAIDIPCARADGATVYYWVWGK